MPWSSVTCRRVRQPWALRRVPCSMAPMALLSRVGWRGRGGGSPASTVAQQPADEGATALRRRIATLSAQNRTQPDRATERSLLALRQDAGIAEMRAARGTAEFVTPDPDGLRVDQPLAEVAAQALTPGNLRAGILRSGCVLVRQLIPPDQATGFAEG